MKKTDVRSYFPKDYADSRTRFKNDVRRLSKPWEFGSWEIPAKSDSDLFVDYAWLPPLLEPEKLLVLITGVHGSETYAGSAILNLFMEEILPVVKRDKLGIFIVHAMNPFGFKHHRRCTENHVNLNRNFSVSGQLFEAKNPVSKTMNDLVQERSAVTSLRSKLLENLRQENGGFYFENTSLEQLTKGIAPGQFERFDDLEYGGSQAEPQTRALIDQMKKTMPAFKDVLALDIHTGLGDRGRLHLLTDGHGKALHPKMFAELFKPQEDESIYAFTSADTEGFYPVFGSTNAMFAELSEDPQRTCAVTLEFGTLGHSLEQQLDGLNRALIEHQGQHFGYADPKLEKQARELNFERSYPDDDNWRKSVLMAAERLFQRIFERGLA